MDQDRRPKNSRSPLLIAKVCGVLNHVVTRHRATPKWEKTVFHAVYPPHISLEDYVLRLCEGFDCSDETLLMSLVYVMRLEQQLHHGVLCPFSAHRVVFTSILVATKFHEDINFSATNAGMVGGVSREEVCLLEASFLKLLDFRMVVQPEEFDRLKSGVVAANIACTVRKSY
jgi:hypothetical protein